MTLSAILQGTLKTLRDTVSLVNDDNSGIRLKDGKPPPTAGQLFYGVHPLRWYAGPSHGNQNIGSDEMFDIGVTLTLRTARVPSSKLTAVGYLGANPSDGSSISLPENVGGMEPKLREVVVALSRNRYTILSNANDRLLTATSNPLNTFDATDVDAVNDQIIITSHGWGSRGEDLEFKYIEDDSGSIAGLTDGQTYKAVVVDADTIELPDVDLLSGSTGENHGGRRIPHPFIEPLTLVGIDAEPREVDEEWFSAAPGDIRSTGWAMTAQFGGARRLQYLDLME